MYVIFSLSAAPGPGRQMAFCRMVSDSVTLEAQAGLESVPRPELMAPAGNWEAVRAAVENGADAVYFGLRQFNARMRADNFTTDELPRLMQFLHERGVRGYACVNTLIFTDELAEAEELVRACISSGVDGLVVQDIGLAQIIRQICPRIPIHASTQMTITHPTGIAMARELGCSLVVLARECSLADIGAIQRALAADGVDMPLQVFVHGALCVSYSGQCLTSESFGGRSANRGECAQACRLPYRLVVDGRVVDCKGARFLLSPRDLSGIAVVPELVRLGVASLKIEGRMKHAPYVANVVRVYREVLDRCRARPAATYEELFSEQERQQIEYRLQMAFSRGLSPGWLLGVNHVGLVHGLYPGKRGPVAGTVRAVTNRSIVIDPIRDVPLSAGDGVVFAGGDPEAGEHGGRIFSILRKDGTVEELVFSRDSRLLQKVKPGMVVYKTGDPKLERELRHTYAGSGPIRRRPLAVHVSGRLGEPLKLTARDEQGNTVELTSELKLEAARTAPLTEAFLAEHLGKLGGTPFFLESLTAALEPGVILPASELNRLRRRMVGALLQVRTAKPHWVVSPDRVVETRLAHLQARKASEEASTAGRPPRLWVLVRTHAQLEVALAAGVSHLYLEFGTPDDVRRALEMCRSANRGHGLDLDELSGWFVVPPRITRPGEEALAMAFLKAGADGVLARNPFHLYNAGGQRVCLDATFNVANPIALAWLKDRFTPERITLGYDLNNRQILDLIRYVPTSWVEVVIHQHMPMFHMDYCLFARWLANAPNKRVCGRPCQKHSAVLRDRKGVDHPVRVDICCRNTVYNGRAQSGAVYVHEFIAAGVQNLRIEFLDESPDQVERAIRLYRALLAGEIDGAAVQKALGAWAQLGVTRGSMDAEQPVTVL